MENQTHFDLTAAIESWRLELAMQSNLSPDARHELETHLEDSIAGLRERGLNDDETFLLARQRTGELQQLNKEFKQAMKANDTSLWNRPLAITAWVMFIISFFLPSFAGMPGWQCATLQQAFWPQALQGQWLSIHYLLLTMANLLMLASPFLLPRFSQNASHLKWLRYLTSGAVILVWSFVLLLIVHGDGPNLRIGCYVWSSSFALLYLSALLQPAGAVKRQTA